MNNDNLAKTKYDLHCQLCINSTNTFEDFWDKHCFLCDECCNNPYLRNNFEMKNS